MDLHESNTPFVAGWFVCLIAHIFHIKSEIKIPIPTRWLSGANVLELLVWCHSPDRLPLLYPATWLLIFVGWTLHSHVPTPMIREHLHARKALWFKVCDSLAVILKSCTNPTHDPKWNVYILYFKSKHLKLKRLKKSTFYLSSCMLLLYNFEATALQLPAFQHQNTNRDRLLGPRVSVNLVTKGCTNCVQW